MTKATGMAVNIAEFDAPLAAAHVPARKKRSTTGKQRSSAKRHQRSWVQSHAGEPVAQLDAPTSAEALREADEEIARRMVLVETAEMARYLQEHLGQKLAAYLAGLKDTKTVGQWAQGRSEPPAITRERLRAAFHATQLFLAVYGDREAQGWFFGANSSLDDQAPAAVLRTAETPAEMALIAPLARAFVRGAH